MGDEADDSDEEEEVELARRLPSEAALEGASAAVAATAPMRPTVCFLSVDSGSEDEGDEDDEEDEEDDEDSDDEPEKRRAKTDAMRRCSCRAPRHKPSICKNAKASAESGEKTKHTKQNNTGMLLRGLRLYTRGVLQQLGASTRRGLSTSSSATGFAATTKKAGAGTFSAREREVLRVLRTVKHPDTGKDVVMGKAADLFFNASSFRSSPFSFFYSPSDGMIAEVREKDGVVSVELHLDKHYRSLKASCVEALTRALTPPASPSDSAAAATEQRWLRSVRVNMSSVPSASELEYRATAMRKVYFDWHGADRKRYQQLL